MTQLAQAVVDAKWRDRWISHAASQRPARPPRGQEAALGRQFHALVATFTRRLVRDDGAHLQSGQDLWHRFYDQLGSRALAALLKQKHVEDAHSLGERLKSFCARLADIRSRVPAAEGWGHVFLTSEQAFWRVPVETSSLPVLVNARVDAVRRHPEHNLEAVDYKVSRGGQQKHDMVQLAIYAAVLERARPGLSFCGTLEYYLPEVVAVEMSPSDLTAVFEDIVRPVLDEYADAVAKRKAPRRVGRQGPPAPPPASLAGAAIQDPVAKQIEAFYKAFKLQVVVTGRQPAPQVVRYKVQPGPGVAVASLARRSTDLQVALSMSAPPLIAAAPGFVAVDVPRDQPEVVRWRDVVQMRAYRNHPSSLCFAIGVSVDSSLIVADFSDANMAHALVAGAPGSGKSEFLRSLVGSLMERTPPEMLRISIVDPKLLTFTTLAKSRHLSGSVMTDVDSAIACLTSAADEMERRYQLLASERLLKLSDRMASGKTDVPYWVIVFDEFADLILRSKESKKEFEQLVARLVQKGRAAGIHLVLATQRPDKEVVTGLIKASLPLKVCLRVTNAANSQIVLGESGGETLLGKGDLLCDMGKGLVRAQSPLITDDELRALNAAGSKGGG